MNPAHLNAWTCLLDAPTLQNRYIFERIVKARCAPMAALHAVVGRIINGGE